MKPVIAWLASGFVTALLALAIATTVLGNRGEASSSWTGGSAPLLAFGVGVLPMSLAHGLCFRFPRRRDSMRLRMARAISAGLVAFGLAMAGLMAWARHHS
jgi:hypothetical protein